MSIEKLIEFATTGDKNTDELDLERGFPSRIYPARQWFNWLFNSLTSKINEIIENKVDKSDLSEISQDEANKGISTESKLISAKVLKNAIAQHVPINNTLISDATDQALSAAQGKFIYDSLLGVNQTWKHANKLANTTYTNTTPKPILVVVNTYGGTSIVDGVTLRYRGDDTEGDWSFIVPSGSTYSVTGNIRSWAELS